MDQIFIFILGVVIGVVIVWYFARNSLGGANGKTLREEQQKNKEDYKKIILQGIEMQKSITNDAVQNLLGVSDATATRYLDELEKEGKIKQVGRTGQGVFYEKR